MRPEAPQDTAAPDRPPGPSSRPATKPPSSGGLDLRALALALALGAVGGALAAYLRVPLGWMIGAMCFTTAAAMAGARIVIPNRLRAFMLAVLGVMLGSAFTPAILEQADRWAASLSVLFLYTVTAAGLAFLYFRRIAQFDPVTAYFSAAPGGLSQMIMIGAAMGGDDRTISLVHGVRVLFVVLTIPFFFRVFEGYEGGGMAPAAVAAGGVTAYDLALLAASGVVGAVIGRVSRMPAPFLLGPMAVSAAVHLAGLTVSQPPGFAVALAQVVIGAAIGCRFAGIGLGRVLRLMVLAAGGTAILLAVAIAYALLLGLVSDLPFSVLLLAYSPGGVAEMSLIGLALGADAAFVSTHHLVRILLVVALAPAVFRARGWLARLRGAEPD